MQAVKEDGGDRGWVPVRLRFRYLWSPTNRSHLATYLVMVHWQSAYPWYDPADAEYEHCPRT